MTGTRPTARPAGARPGRRRERAVRLGGPPIALIVPALAAVVFLALPLAGVLVRTPWSDLAARLTEPDVTQAFRLSLVVSCWALALSLLVGVPLAWVLARVSFPGKTLVRALVMLPMVLPPTVGGVALLLGFGRRGLMGPLLLDWFGVTLPFSTTGAVIAAAFVAMPFLIISLEGTLTALRPRYEETATSLGARPLRAFFTVTLPMTAPGLVAGAALCWARALGEFGATITFAGNLPGVTQTLPLQVYLMLQEDPEGATAVSLLLLVVAMAVLIVLRGRWTGAKPLTARPADRDAPASPASAGSPSPPPAVREARPPGALASAAGAGAGAAGAGAVAGAGAGVGAAGGPVWPLAAEITGYTHLTLTAAPGTTIAVVGPNGAGKTTLLRALLGLSPLSRARTLRLGEVDAARRPPHRRGVAWVPQDGALFPHLSALSNTAYGLRAQGVRRKAARALAHGWLERLGVGELADRKPGRLSGGQAQRVALARALAARPRLLLLDEPLAALDQTTRSHVRHTLREHLAGFPGVCLIVTHDPVEAVSLADHVLVLEDGRQVQYAPPAEVARHPRSPWVARMLGRNAWSGVLRGDVLELPGGARLVTATRSTRSTRSTRAAEGSQAAEDSRAARESQGAQDARTAEDGSGPGEAPGVAGDPGVGGDPGDPQTPGAPDGIAALAVVGPEAVSLHRDKPSGSPRNVWRGRVREMTALGGRMRVLVGASDEARGLDVIAEITTAAAADLALADGEQVWVSVKATEITVVTL